MLCLINVNIILSIFSSVSECLLEIGSDEVLVVEAISYLCEQLDNNNPYEDASLSSKLFKSNVKKIATKSSLTVRFHNWCSKAAKHTDIFIFYTYFFFEIIFLRSVCFVYRVHTFCWYIKSCSLR